VSQNRSVKKLDSNASGGGLTRGAAAFIRQSGLTFGVNTLNTFFNAVQGIVIARVLGPSGKGTLYVIMQLSKLVLELGHLSIGPSNAYHVGGKKIPASRAYGASFYFAVAISVVMAFVVAAIFPFLKTALFSDTDPRLAIAVLAIVPLSLFTSYIQHISLGLQQVGRYNLVEFSKHFTEVMLIVAFLLWLRMGIPGVIVGLIIGRVLSTVLAMVLLGRSARIEFRIPWSEVRSLLSFGLQTHGILMLSVLSGPLTTFILKYKTDSATVGVYSVAISLSMLMLKLPDSVGTVLFPRVAASSREQASAMSSRVCRNTTFVTILICIAGAVAGPPMIRLLYGEEFAASGAVFLWLLPGVVLFGIYRILYRDLLGQGKPLLLMLSFASSIPVTVALTWVLAGPYGSVGAAIATCVGYGVTALMALFFYVREYRIPIASVLLVNRADLALYFEIWRAVARRRF